MNESTRPILIVLAVTIVALASLICIVAALGLGLCPPSGPAHTPTATGSRTVSGLVRDAITSQAIPEALVRAGTETVYTDESGTFAILVPAGSTIHTSATGYEEQEESPTTNTVLVELVRTPAATYDLIHTYQMQHEYGRQYDLLHPDVQAQFSRDDFVRIMERTVDYEIVARSYGAVTTLSTWTFQDRAYTNVAQVPFTLTIRRAGQEQTLNDTGILARAAGTWHWFWGSAEAPTATPTGPTSTPEAQPFPVGSWVQVTAGNLNVRSGPGTGYRIVTTVSYGTQLQVLAGPNTLDATPWYEVSDGGSVHGWCSGSYLAPSSPPTVTPTTTPTEGPWFPVGSWVQASSPTGRVDIRLGPDPSYAIVAVAPNGTRMRIMVPPTVVDRTPWYQVMDENQTFQGWCSGQYLVSAIPPPPTVTTTPTRNPDFPSGTWVLVASPDGQSHVRNGPGAQYPILRTLPNGTRLRVVSGPTWVDSAPWYLIADEGQTFQGWCNGDHLVIAPTTPTPSGASVTPTTESGFPVGSWVQVQSPDGELNIRQGAGVSYPIVHVAHNGDPFRIVAGPTWADDASWYQVIDPTGAIEGWCSGSYLALLPATPTSTVPQGGARFTELQFCVIPPGGGAADCSGDFHHPVYEVYIVWDYENMASGMAIRCEWFLDGQPLRTSEEQWDYTKYGAQGTRWDVRMSDRNGIQPGSYRLELYLNDVKQQEQSFTITP